MLLLLHRHLRDSLSAVLLLLVELELSAVDSQARAAAAIPAEIHLIAEASTRVSLLGEAGALDHRAPAFPQPCRFSLHLC